MGRRNDESWLLPLWFPEFHSIRNCLQLLDGLLSSRILALVSCYFTTTNTRTMVVLCTWERVRMKENYLDKEGNKEYICIYIYVHINIEDIVKEALCTLVVYSVKSSKLTQCSQLEQMHLLYVLMYICVQWIHSYTMDRVTSALIMCMYQVFIIFFSQLK